MAAGDNYFNCTEHLTLEQALMKMLVIDANGDPVFKQFNPLNSSVSQTLFTGGGSSAANWTAFQTWKTANATKRVLRVTPFNVSATESGFGVEYTS